MEFAWPSRRVLLGLAGAAVVLLAAAWVRSVASEARYRQETVGKPLEGALGFRLGSPSVEEDGRSGA